MKIVLAIDSFPPYTSGVTTHYLELSRKLVSLGHEVLIFAPKYDESPKLPKQLEKVKIIYLPSIPTKIALNFRLIIPLTFKIASEILKFKPDIIETSGPSLLGIYVIIISRIFRIPHVSYFYTLVSSEEYMRLAFNSKIILKILTRISFFYIKWFYSNTNSVFVPTQKVKEILAKYTIPKNKIIITPVITDLENIRRISRTNKKNLKDKYHLKKQVAVYLGRLSKEKGLELLPKIWLEVVKQNTNYSLLIIGNGKYKKVLEKKVKQLNLQDSIVFTGKINHDALFSSGILHCCNLFISPSISETFGIATLEAMAHSLPVILAKSQGICEFTNNCGYICKANDINCFAKSILRIFSNRKLQTRLRENARKIALQFNSLEGAQTILNNYNKIIEIYNLHPND